MIIEWVAGILLAPAVGWALSVENRLRGRQELKDDLEKVKTELKADIGKVADRQEDLIDFLLRNHSGRSNKG